MVQKINMEMSLEIENRTSRMTQQFYIWVLMQKN